MSFFPQVTSGPISTAKDLMPQFKTPHVFKYEQGRDGLKLLLWGLFLKLAIADRLGIYVDTVYTNFIHYSGGVCFLASILYTIQIYCDFAGYSYMAIGIAKTLGFDLVNNFERPYLSASVTEFWKRWHISLTRWLTTHVYINLGGNRCSKVRQYANILITFMISGLWHGANWTFVIWGVLHGFYQIVEKALMGARIKNELKSYESRLSSLRLIRVIVTFNMVSFAWIFFRMPNIKTAKCFIEHIVYDFHFAKESLLTNTEILLYGISLLMLFVYDIHTEYLKALFSRNICLKWCFWLFIVCFIMSFGILDGSSFIYVSF